MKVAVALVSLCAALLLAGPGAAVRADNPVLTGNVGQGDSFTITLADASGAAVKHLDPGTYTLVVHDHSAFHNFDLSGPGVAVATPIETVGDSTFTVTLTDGTYFFQCDPHALQMRGSFTVGAVPTTTTPTTPPPVTATPLVATLGPGTTSSLRPIARLSAGRFSVAVNDRSRTDGFALVGPGVSRATGKAFRGRITWKLSLSAGRYSYGSALHPKRRHTFTVSG